MIQTLMNQTTDNKQEAMPQKANRTAYDTWYSYRNELPTYNCIVIFSWCCGCISSDANGKAVYSTVMPCYAYEKGSQLNCSLNLRL